MKIIDGVKIEGADAEDIGMIGEMIGEITGGIGAIAGADAIAGNGIDMMIDAIDVLDAVGVEGSESENAGISAASRSSTAAFPVQRSPGAEAMFTLFPIVIATALMISMTASDAAFAPDSSVKLLSPTYLKGKNAGASPPALLFALL